MKRIYQPLIAGTIAMTSLIGSVAMAQDADLTAELANSHYQPVPTTQAPIGEKPFVPVAGPNGALAAEQAWDGEKPFLPEMHAPQFSPRTMALQMLNAFAPAAKAAFNLRDVDVQELAMAQQNGQTLVALRLPVVEGRAGGDHIVRLHPYSMRAPDALVLVQVEGGMLVEHQWPEVTTYRGTIDGMPDVEVAASIVDGNVSMLIMPLAEGGAQDPWFVQPLSDGFPGLPDGVHVVYRGSDVIPQPRPCGVEVEAGPINQAPNANDGVALAQRLADQWPLQLPAPLPQKADDLGPNEPSEPRGESSFVANVRCQIALDADYEYYLANGSSVLNTIHEMERVLNFVGLIYQGQVAIAYTETAIFIRANINDPYNTGLTGSGMRDEFRNHWVANHAGITRDVAHLFSNRSSTDGFIGFAYFAGICNNNNSNNSGHCWSSTFWSADIANKVGTVAHELGHVWNATHCDGAAGCGIMNSGINGSWSFGTPSANLIIAHRDSRPCLDVWQNPTYVNWAYGGTETGSITQPWNTIFEGLDACLVGGTLNVQAGNYFQNPNIFKAKNINALNGTVRIGSN